MLRTACVAVAAFVLAGIAGATAPVLRITQTSIAGAELGLSRTAYRKPLGGKPKIARLEGGLTRLDFPRNASVFFRSAVAARSASSSGASSTGRPLASGHARPRRS